jgi:hypothetical protein
MKNAQSSLEFMMTYGWVILLVLVSISTLLYLGIIDVRETLPQQAIFSPMFEAEAFAFVDGKIILLIKNNLFEPIVINPTNYKGTNDCEVIDFSYTQGLIQPSESFELNFTCSEINIKRIKTYLSFNYTNMKSNVDHIHTGYVVVNN